MITRTIKIEYRCLQCGSEHGEPAEDNIEHWYWTFFPYGRVGPFCTKEHSEVFWHKPDAEPRYTIAEMEKLLFVRWQHENGVQLPIVTKD